VTIRQIFRRKQNG